MIFFLFACVCFWLLFSGLLESVSGLISLSVILFGIFTLFQIINLRSVFKIIVSEKGIIKTSFISNEKEFIPFSSIANIQLTRVNGYSTSDAGQITTGYFESLITLKNNKKLIISPDYFENYQEIIKAIKMNMEKLD